MNNNDFNDLINLITRLRGDDGCPWDKKQTPQSMALYLIEEVHELVEAIRSRDIENICEELGDVLFLVFFVANLFGEQGKFDIYDVLSLNLEKMIGRHPHVFGTDTVENAEEVRQRWHQLKKKEKNHDSDKSLMDSVPTSLPALMRAYRISERAARIGFDWDDLSGVMRKTEEEWNEFKAELGKAESDQSNNSSSEFGDILFTLVNVARFAKVHPETALAESVAKFEKRFRYMEKAALTRGMQLESVPREDMEKLWDQAKNAGL
ncbi:MAG: nucleoside triphosphate pyrophosphohydrolase [Desulfobacteraceae bacterium]|nr:nucleoside triphosphate pyrophosphohydrolase [Desulfobacteraceae bacterium]